MKRRQRGMTLIEVIIAMVVVGICIVAALSMMSSLSMRSASSMTRTQAAAIAASYLDEILGKRFLADGREVSRAQYDDVLDYDDLDEMGARNINGAIIPGLDRYRVRVDVNGELLPNNVLARRIEVTVTDPSNVPVLLTGYRTDYTGQVHYE
jgi:MSHA pilin protein MshD